MSEKSPVASKLLPAGAMVEVDLDLINSGLCKAMIEQRLRQAHVALREYEEESGDRTAAAVVTVKFKLLRQKGSDQFFDIEYNAEMKSPTTMHVASVKSVGDMLLCQPSGADEGDPDQLQLFYNGKGKVIGGMKRGENLTAEEATELHEKSKDVAGKITRARNGA